MSGTPAAQLALRYAAGGLIIDLTERSRLKEVPPGPYVTMARTGLPPAGLTRAVAAFLTIALVDRRDDGAADVDEPGAVG